jgi:hypothetical protein
MGWLFFIRLKNMKAKKIFLNLVVLTGILPFIVGAYLIFHRPLPVPTQPVSSAREPIVSGFEFSRYEKGKKLFTVNAREAYLTDKKIPRLGFCLGPFKTTRLEEVKVVFFADNQPASRLISQYATMDLRKKDFIFEGSPALLTRDNRLLSAESIAWDGKAKLLRAQGNCFLGAADKQVSAEALTTDCLLKNFQLSR